MEKSTPQENPPYIWTFIQDKKGFPSNSVSEESASNAGDPGSIPWLGKSPEEGESRESYPWYHRVAHDWETNTYTHTVFLSIYKMVSLSQLINQSSYILIH